MGTDQSMYINNIASLCDKNLAYNFLFKAILHLWSFKIYILFSTIFFDEKKVVENTDLVLLILN
jgi:hypothetical protein